MLFRPFPVILIGLALTACVKAAKTAKAQAPLAVLEGSEWAPELEAGAGLGADMFVAFKSGGDVIGHGGCNRFFGSYEHSGNTLTFGPLASTRMACQDMSGERAFMQALQSTRTIEATHLRLVLLGEDGSPILSLRRRDWD